MEMYLLEELSEEWKDTRIVYTTSESIHVLGIIAGSKVKLNYSWEDLSVMFEDFKNKITQIVIEEDGEEEIILFDGWVPRLEDVFWVLEQDK